MHVIIHPVWGCNIANQVAVHPVSDFGDDGDGYRLKKTKGLFGREVMRRVYVRFDTVPATDADETVREFSHRCELLKLVLASGPTFVAFLDGHVTSLFDTHEVSFRFDPEALKLSEGRPIADVQFQASGTRNGPFTNYGTSEIVCTFADRAQMDQYVDVSNRRVPKSITHKGVTYSSTGSGDYQSSDGSILPMMVVMYLMLSSNEQQAFAAQNPDVHEMISGDGGDFGGGGASANTPDGPDYGDSASQSDMGGTESSTDTSVSSSDSISSFDGGGGGGGTD